MQLASDQKNMQNFEDKGAVKMRSCPSTQYNFSLFREKEAHDPLNGHPVQKCCRIEQPPDHPDQRQYEHDKAPAFVGLKEGKLLEDVRHDLGHVDAEPQHEENDRGDGPVQQSRQPAPAGRGVTQSHRQSLHSGRFQIERHADPWAMEALA